ncbi:helix-turn-helix domain-containing protein [Cellulophaga sp. HaHaR_3_176]|uniref:AraC family transcriptional regulator n=1 Tax=Cellulophaga sp. HaHaR_3_176 TaxID=1942464 RepID=UPI001C1FF1E4|nr:helix-turn-helix domain-containing protein [Cellulophaga sp. HaHaR_3_176]QWX83132.1 helix-turn-helix domain-containing protein [Cellulophaga sp. HaHaR_3_176]
MSTILHIKNMVCDRCKMIVSQSLEEIGITILNLELGVVTITSKEAVDYDKIREVLKNKGFELILDKNKILIDKIKTNLIAFVDILDSSKEENISVFLSQRMNRDYSVMSKLFSKTENVSIEKYVINLKIEKAKELIQMNRLSFSEIAYTLAYKSSSHLARQFKLITGFSMSEYKTSQKWNRTSLDRIV